MNFFCKCREFDRRRSRFHKWMWVGSPVAALVSSAIFSTVSPAWKPPIQPKVKIVAGGESAAKPEDCRGTVVGPGINQPDPFPGYGGFVGFESPVRLKNGTWLIGFNAGYWHASAPTPFRYPANVLEEYRGYGMPVDLDAPTGGRAMIVRSRDQGKDLEQAGDAHRHAG